MKTVLFVGAGRHQRRAIRRAKELGLGVAVAAARRLAPDGVLTIASDRAVPVVAAIAETLGLPGIGAEAALLATNKIAMRGALAAAGVPQPRFASVRTVTDAQAAAPE